MLNAIEGFELTKLGRGRLFERTDEQIAKAMVGAMVGNIRRLRPTRRRRPKPTNRAPTAPALRTRTRSPTSSPSVMPRNCAIATTGERGSDGTAAAGAASAASWLSTTRGNWLARRMSRGKQRRPKRRPLLASSASPRLIPGWPPSMRAGTRALGCWRRPTARWISAPAHCDHRTAPTSSPNAPPLRRRRQVLQHRSGTPSSRTQLAVTAT